VQFIRSQLSKIQILVLWVKKVTNVSRDQWWVAGHTSAWHAPTAMCAASHSRFALLSKEIYTCDGSEKHRLCTEPHGKRLLGRPVCRCIYNI